jgi:hypothetical protein
VAETAASSVAALHLAEGYAKKVDVLWDWRSELSGTLRFVRWAMGLLVLSVPVDWFLLLRNYHG